MVENDSALTVGDLIDALGKLPRDARIRETRAVGEDLVIRKDGLFLVYKDQDVVELHIDDGQGWHASYVERRLPLWQP